MFLKDRSRLTAIVIALFVTVLWSTSWIIVKVGLRDIPPLTFAGLRYVWAFLLLLPAAFLHTSRRSELMTLSRRDWGRLVLLGLIFYTVTQGLIYVALEYLRAATLSLLLNFTSAFVAILAVFWLAEIPKLLQWIGISIFLLGAWIYFYPLGTDEPAIGLLVGVLVVVANAIASLLGRDINRTHSLDPMVVTLVSMGAGSVMLLLLGLTFQGLPPMDLRSWVIVGWLAVVNSALAFTLWNLTQRTLSATESSVINNTMLIQIAVLAWVFLDEQLTPQEIVGLALAAFGIILVQLPKPAMNEETQQTPSIQAVEATAAEIGSEQEGEAFES